MGEKYSFIFCHSTLGVTKSCKTLGKKFYMILIPLGWDGRIFYGSLYKSLIFLLYGKPYFTANSFNWRLFSLLISDQPEHLVGSL